MDKDLYKFIKEFFLSVEHGLDDAFEWIEKIFPSVIG